MEDEEFAVRHVYGALDAPVTVVEFADFECPYCAAAAPVLRALVDTSENQVRLAFRHFPLFQPHPYALTAALASEAASEQGAFWPMHGLLFKHQDRLADRDLVRYAAELDLDTSSLVGAPAQRFGAAIERDYREAANLGVHGTPTVFLGQDPYTGRIELGALRAEIGRLGRRRGVEPRSRG
ncbi:thioredoxin-like protein [Antricoccus suffuscus]|uniref:Thioredoxin-like protein n=1 Tax=Antricoccus suffuscus TaxID=1629062 RepID=A0A2T0ZZW3_9ACTN|nr:DsbA family protein [Antricoccus suffuscus]PRZ41895.1 thioredoxin-like protein [Antricoccus suffuscus]